MDSGFPEIIRDKLFCLPWKSLPPFKTMVKLLLNDDKLRSYSFQKCETRSSQPIENGGRLDVREGISWVYNPAGEVLFHLLTTWNPKQPFINGCFNWVIPNLYRENGCFTKRPFINGCLGFHVFIVMANQPTPPTYADGNSRPKMIQVPLEQRKKPGCLYRGWNPTQFYRDHFINHHNDPVV